MWTLPKAENTFEVQGVKNSFDYGESMVSQGILFTWRYEIRLYRAMYRSANNNQRRQSETCQSTIKSEDLDCQLPNFGQKFSGTWLEEMQPTSQGS